MTPRWLVVSGCSILGLIHPFASRCEAEWQQVSLPYRNADVRGLALAPSSPSTVYIVTDNTVYRSDERGASWSRTSLQIPPGSSLGAIVVSPSDPDRVLLAVGGAVHETADGGASWAELSPPIAKSIDQFLIHPETSGVVLAVPGEDEPGIYRSTNGGVSWEFLSEDLEDTRVRRIALQPAAGGILVGTTENGVIRSLDGGETWIQEDTGPNVAGVAWSADPSRVFTAGWDGLFRSDDAGETFSPLGAPSGGYSWRYYDDIATHPTDPNVLFLSGCETGYGHARSAGLVRSENGGEDFTNRFLPSQVWEGTPSGVAIDPIEPDNLYYSTFSGRRGGFWHFCGPGLSGSELRNAEFHHYGVRQVSADGQGRTYAVVDSRVVQSNAAGADWAEVDNTYWDYIWQGGPQIALAVNEGGAAFYTAFGWTIGPSASSGYAFDTERTLDGGLTWDPVLWMTCGYNPMACGGSEIVTNHGDGDVFYLLGASYSAPDLYRMDEMGEVLVSPGHGPAKLLIHPDDPLRIYSTFGADGFSESLDGGETWSPVDEGLPAGEPVAIFMRRDQPEVFQFVYPDGSIYHSVNAAGSWELLDTMDVGAASVEKATWDPVSGHVFALTDDERLVSTWPLDTSDLPPRPLSIHYSAAGRALLVGTARHGLFERPLRILHLERHSELAPESSGGPDAGSPGPALRLSPNPTDGFLRVGIDAPDALPVRVDVFDASGRLVRRLVDRSDRSGLVVVEWDGRARRGGPVPSGVYFVRMESGSRTEVRKVTVIR